MRCTVLQAASGPRGRMALLGIISDTHGRAAAARRAVEMLLSRGATRIVHLGDVGGEQVLDQLAGLDAIVVFGNCDDAGGLSRYARSLGISVAHPAAIIEMKSRRIGMTHGHLEREVLGLFEAEPDYLLHGHTHAVRDEIVGATRVLNPGALSRAVRLTAMLLDPESGSVEWIEIDERAPDAAASETTGGP